MLYKSNLLTLRTVEHGSYVLWILWYGPKRPFLSILVYIAYIGLFGTGYAGIVIG